MDSTGRGTDACSRGEWGVVTDRHAARKFADKGTTLYQQNSDLEKSEGAARER